MSPFDFDIPDLSAALEELLAQVPRGRVTTYGRLAGALGSGKAAVWVGEYLLRHDHDARCRCHRVVRHDGELGRYVMGGVGSVSEKQRRLEKDGVCVEAGRVVDLKSRLFETFRTDRPLQKLLEIQENIPLQVQLQPFRKTPGIIAGVDVSYACGQWAVGGCALVETGTGKLVHSLTVEQRIRFPYISGFLTFRELPVLLALLKQLESERGRPEIVLVDGNGILHPRGAGIATHLGVVSGFPTIGVSKKLLCGKVDADAVTPESPQPVVFEERIVGAALRAEEHSRPIFVSPGHLTDVDDAVRIVQTVLDRHRLPEPIYHADRLSRRAAKGLSESGHVD